MAEKYMKNYGYFENNFEPFMIIISVGSVKKLIFILDDFFLLYACFL